MSNSQKLTVLADLERRFGELRKLKGSESLYVVGNEAARIYFRYSKVHERGRTFFGLRAVDLRQLEGQNSYICFLLDSQLAPIFVSYADFEEVFANSQPASDGQFKVQLLTGGDALELYISRQGRFNVEGYVGFETLESSVERDRTVYNQQLSHSQVQTLLAGIGHAKGYDVYVPDCDLCRLDWSLTDGFELRRELPAGFEQVRRIMSEIDVVWIASGRNNIEGLYEVEHSTPVYSGLLRFNDVLLTSPQVNRFSIVSNDARRELFSRQVSRPTFRKSGLTDLCSFLEYANVMSWHERVRKGELHGAQRE
jgi:hypothetical protein